MKGPTVSARAAGRERLELLLLLLDVSLPNEFTFCDSATSHSTSQASQISTSSTRGVAMSPDARLGAG